MNMSSVVPIGLKTRMDDRMRAALNAMPVAVSWYRMDNGRVEFMNRRFTELFGYTPDAVGDVYELMRKIFVDPVQAERAIEGSQRLIASGIVDEVRLPSEEIEAFRRDGTRLFTSFSGVMLPEANMCLATFMDITEAKTLRDKLAELASQDELTRLVNRRFFDLKLAQTINHSFPNQPFGVLIIDLDDFKGINDSHGHAAGDMVLKHFANLMRDCFRASDCTSRWGGDEFAVIVQHPTSREDVNTAATRLRRALAEHPVTVNGSQIVIEASIGVAYYPEDGQAMTGLYNVADARMYEEKRRKKGGSIPWPD